MDKYSEHQIRLFRPVILFHDDKGSFYPSSTSTNNKTPLCTTKDDNYVAKHKQRITDMLKTNSQIWSELINSTRQWNSTPSLPPIHLSTFSSIDKRRRGNLPKPVTAILKRWLLEHCRNPYPTEEEKLQLKDETQLTLNQISNWFINARRRTLPVILAKLNHHYPGIKARRRRRRQRQGKVYLISLFFVLDTYPLFFALIDKPKSDTVKTSLE
ncbi:homeobox KN domain-containing protein [Chlamydoabsidia padenii]|nr:homeobox KN domain-containing protein [Chlamydoabsidia padenii]